MLFFGTGEADTETMTVRFEDLEVLACAPIVRVQWHPPPSTKGRLPESFLDELLLSTPLGYEGRDVCVHIATVPAPVWRELKESWEYRSIASGRDDMGGALSEAGTKAMLQAAVLRGAVPGHIWG